MEKFEGSLQYFFKRREIEIARNEGKTWNIFKKAPDESIRQMQEAGFNERIV